MDERDTGSEPMTDVPASHDDPSASAPPPKRRRRHWGWILFGVFVVLPVLAFVLWTAAALNWSYSVGQRAGFVQKFSEKGWLCKTWEGELAMVNLPGAMPEIFKFSVRNDSIAKVIEDNLGKRVSLSYQQHKGVPTSCFGETEYYVTNVRIREP